jgi:hypothetical protein
MARFILWSWFDEALENSSAVAATSRYLLSIVSASAKIRYPDDPGELYVALLLGITSRNQLALVLADSASAGQVA